MKNSWKLFLIVVLVILGAVGLAAWLKSISPPTVLPDQNIKGEKVFIRDYSPMTGSKEAKVQLVEFGDFQCPACAAANPTIVQLLEKYKANPNFNFVFRNFPLPQHSSAQISAEAAMAAGSQGKFFEMDKLLYEHQADWAGTVSTKSALVDLANQIGLDINKFQDEINNSKYINQITQDQKDGEALGVNSTPTFFLNEQKVSDYTKLETMISELLK